MAVLAAVLGSAVAALAMAVDARAQVPLGKPGEPVRLIVGYQPGYTQAWSALVLKGKELSRRHLPAGSTVEFQTATSGTTIVNAITGQQQDIGYVGEMSAIAATFRALPDRGGTDIRIMASTGTSRRLCSAVLVRVDAGDIGTGADAVKWLDGKAVGAPHGTCADLAARSIFAKAGISPKAYANLADDGLAAAFRTGRIDAAVAREPAASRLVAAGAARRIATGEAFDLVDSGFVVMTAALAKARPDVVRGWLEAELDAQLYLADPANTADILAIAEAETGFSRKTVAAALYGADEPGAADPMRLSFDFALTERVRGLLAEGTRFLNGLPNKPAASDKLRPEAIDDAVARAILLARGLPSPVAALPAWTAHDARPQVLPLPIGR